MHCIATTALQQSQNLLISCTDISEVHSFSLWKSLLTNYAQTGRWWSVNVHTCTNTIFRTTNVPQSTYCLAAALNKWHYEDIRECLQLIHDTEWMSSRWLLWFEGKTKPVLLFMLGVFVYLFFKYDTQLVVYQQSCPGPSLPSVT